MKKFKFSFGTLFTVLLVLALLMSIGVTVLRLLAIIGAMDMLSTNLPLDICLVILSTLVTIFITLILTTSTYRFEPNHLLLSMVLVNEKYLYHSICRLILNLSDNKLWMYYTSNENQPCCINIRISPKDVEAFVNTIRVKNPSIIFLEVDPTQE